MIHSISPNSRNGKEVSKADPCPNCGATKWCFWIDNDRRDALQCKADLRMPGWKKTGEGKDGRPIYRPESEKSTPFQPYTPRPPKLKAKNPQFPQAIALKHPVGEPLLQWQPTKERDGNEYEKQMRFPISSTLEMSRWQWTDRRPAYDGETKKIRPRHLENGVWKEGIGSQKEWPLYREKEACEGAETVLIVEGEGCVESMRSLGIPAAWGRGGAGSNIPTTVKRLKLYNPSLVICIGDNDAIGKESAQKMANALIAEGIAAISFGWDAIHSDLKQKGDIADIISYYESEGIEREAIADFVREEIETIANQILQEIAANPPAPETEMQSNIVQFPYEQHSQEEFTQDLESLANSSLSRHEELQLINRISKKYRQSPNEVARIVEEFKKEKEQEIENYGLAEKIESLNDLEASTRRLKLADFLPEKLAKPLAIRAQFLGAPESAILTTLLPTAASLIHANTRLQLRSKYSARPIFWSCVVGNPGAKKSPMQDILLDPIYRLQSAEDERFDSENRDYQQALSQAKGDRDSTPPDAPNPPRDYLIIDATSEAVAKILCRQKGAGILHYMDELKGLLTGFNQYRSGGKGSDVEKLLSLRSGKAIKVDRADGTRLFTESTAYSITGGIQPDVLSGLMKDFSDGNGFWSRFVFCHFPKMPLQHYPEDLFIDTDPMMESLYHSLSKSLPCTHTLTKEAKEAFKAWEWEIDSMIHSGDYSGGMVGFLGKLGGMTGEMALILHRINEAFSNPGGNATYEVGVETMQKAIALARFYFDQLRLIYAEGAAKQGELAPTLQAILKYANGRGWLTASKIKNNVRSLKGNATTDDIRRYFSELSRLGMGETEGAGVKLRYRYEGLNCRQRVDILSTVSKMPETFTERGLEGLNKNQTVDNYRQPCLQPQILTTQEFEGLGVGSVDNFSSSQNSQEILTHELTEESIENNAPSTLSTVSQNPCSVSDSAVDNLSTVCLQLSTPSQEAIAPMAPSPTPKPPTSRYKEGDKVRYVGKRHPARNGCLYRVLEVSGDGFMLHCQSLGGSDQFWPHLSDLRSADG